MSDTVYPQFPCFCQLLQSCGCCSTSFQPASSSFSFFLLPHLSHFPGSAKILIARSARHSFSRKFHPFFKQLFLLSETLSLPEAHSAAPRTGGFFPAGFSLLPAYRETRFIVSGHGSCQHADLINSSFVTAVFPCASLP